MATEEQMNYVRSVGDEFARRIMKKIDIDNRAFREHVANCAKLKDVTDFSDFRDHNRFCDVGYALAGKPFKSHNQ